MTTSLEYIAVFVVITLTILSFWMDYRRRKAEKEQTRKTEELKKALLKLDANLDKLQTDLRILFPTFQDHEN